MAVSSDPTATFNGVGFLPPFPEGLGLARNTKNFEVESLAVFADATWHVTDSIDLIAGARYTQDDVLNARTSFGIAPSCNCGPPDPAFFPSFVNFARPPASGDTSFDDVSPTRRYPLRMERRGQRVRDDLEGLQGRRHEHRQQHQRRRIPGVQRASTTKRRSGTTRSASRPSSPSGGVRLNASVFFMDWDGPAGRGLPVPDARRPVVELRADGQRRCRRAGRRGRAARGGDRQLHHWRLDRLSRHRDHG